MPFDSLPELISHNTREGHTSEASHPHREYPVKRASQVIREHQWCRASQPVIEHHEICASQSGRENQSAYARQPIKEDQAEGARALVESAPQTKFDEATLILQSARWLLARRYGWCRGAYVRNDVGHCSLGAVFTAGGLDAYALPHRLPRSVTIALDRLREAAQPKYETDGFTRYSDIACWNDMRSSKRPILAAFDRAIRDS